MEHGIRFAAVVMMAVAASVAFSGPRLSGSVMFAGRVPWDALMVLVVVLPVYVGVAQAIPGWSSMVVALVGLGCLVLGSTSQLLLSVGTAAPVAEHWRGRPDRFWDRWALDLPSLVRGRPGGAPRWATLKTGLDVSPGLIGPEHGRWRALCEGVHSVAVHQRHVHGIATASRLREGR